MENKYTGYRTIDLNEEELSRFYNGEAVFDLMPNEYGIIMLNGVVQDKCKGTLEGVKRVLFQTIGEKTYGIYKPRNLEQELAFDLMNSEVPIKLISGTWGSGKTMCLCASAMEKIRKGEFQKIVWVRNNVVVKDTEPLGALPGSEFEKLYPWVGPLADHAGGEEGIKYLLEEGQLDVVHLGFLRGRDIRNSIIICTESENLTKEHIQLLLGRVGEGSQLWMDTDIRQRDKRIFERSAGIETMIERLRGNPLFGYVHLVKSERSEVAQLADLLD